MNNKGFEYKTPMGAVKVREKYLVAYFDAVDKTQHYEVYNDFKQAKQEYEDIYATIRYQPCFFTTIVEKNDWTDEDYNGEVYDYCGEDIYGK